VRRWALIGGLLVVVVVAAYVSVLREKTVAARLTVPRPTAVIGEGSEAVGVGPDGVVLNWLPAPEGDELPRLPLVEPPSTGRLAGPALQQARVLGAAPDALRPHIESSYFGESGVDVILRSGIELRFGDASRAAEKWRAAAAVLADPTTTALDYVNVTAPRNPGVGGEGHALPPVP
jgi:hypothetical protein